jgi:hypothetical protein
MTAISALNFCRIKLGIFQLWSTEQVGGLINNIFDKLKEIVSPGDELVEDKPATAVKPTTTVEMTESGPPKLVEGSDYYMEGPYMVMTAKYLMKRGYCCESGCRHCPYGFNRKKRAQNSENSSDNNIDKTIDKTEPQ